MKLLDKYIFKQIALATLLGIVIFIVVWISPEILFKIVRKAVNGEITPLLALKIFLYNIPDILGKAIPVGLMLGSLFVFDRLSRDSEIVIFRGSGTNFYRLMIPVVALGIIGYISCFITLDYLIPKSTSALKAVKNETSQNYFVYVDKTLDNKPKSIMIIGNYDGNNCRNIKYLTFSDKVDSDTPIMSSIITAEYANWMKDHWTLVKGEEYQIAPDGVYKDIIKFKSQDKLYGDSAKKSYKLLINSTKKSTQMDLRELKHHINLLNSADMKDEGNYMLTKYYQRYSQPFSCILLGLCGVILGFSRPREKRVLGFTIGVALIFLYYIIVPFLDMLAQNAILYPVIAAWVPNILIFSAMMVMVKYKNI